MPLTDEQSRMVQEVGETDDGRIAANVAAVFAIWAGKDALYAGLTWLYVKRELVELAIGAERAKVDFTSAQDLGMKMSDKAGALQTMYDKTLAEIIRIESKARGSRPGASLELVTQTPQSSPWPSPPYPNANSRRLRGDPYRRPLFGRDSGLP
jgi:hypothetical protein